MAEFPRDQFDDIPRDLKRVGAHRAPARSGRSLVALGWAALSTVVLVGVGLLTLSLLDGGGSALPGIGQETPATSAPPVETAPPVTDPSTIDPELELTITVLNGSPTEDLQSQVGEALEEQGWPVGTLNNAQTRDVETTAVYYNSSEFEGIARGVLEAIGGEGEVRFSDVYLGAPITIVLGADYGA